MASVDNSARVPFRILSASGEYDARDVVALLTGIVLIVVAHGWLFTIISSIYFLLILFHGKLRRSPVLWFAIVLAWTPQVVLNWHHHEDHIYLMLYWVGAVGLSFMCDDWSDVLRCNARLLIGLAFAFAAFWKLASVEFYDGSLMHYKLLFDYRFRETMTEPLGAVSPTQTARNLESLRSLRAHGSDLTNTPIEFSPRLTNIAVVMTWWTIVIEAALAAFFLIPGNRIWSFLRNASLLVFAVTTYLVVPVLGFGNLFMAMGYAQCENSEKRTKIAYLATSILLLAGFCARSLIDFL